MPSPPNGVLQRLNYIKDFFFDPCDAPFTLYVETMLPALLEAAILWYAPVPDEIFTAWARPSKALARYRSGRKGTRGSKGGRKGPKSLAGRIINFDTNEFIGKRLPGAELLGRGGVNWLNFTLWRIFAFTQLLGLIWLVWEVVSGFFVRWFSLLYETEYCRETTSAVLDSVGFGQLVGSIVENNGWLALTVRKQRGPIQISVGSVSSPLNNLTVAASTLIEGDIPAGTWFAIDMWEGFVGNGEPIASTTQFVGGSIPRTISVGTRLRSGGVVAISCRTNAGLLLLTRNELYAQAGR